MKRGFPLLLCALFVASSLLACGGNDGVASSETIKAEDTVSFGDDGSLNGIAFGTAFFELEDSFKADGYTLSNYSPVDGFFENNCTNFDKWYPAGSVLGAEDVSCKVSYVFDYATSKNDQIVHGDTDPLSMWVVSYAAQDGSSLEAIRSLWIDEITRVLGAQDEQEWGDTVVWDRRDQNRLYAAALMSKYENQSSLVVWCFHDDFNQPEIP